jgi:hypothetical protein
MKSLFFALAAAALPVSLAGQDNYTIKMSVKTEGLPAEYAAYGEQDIVTYVKGDKSKTEISSMMLTSTVWYDGNVLTSVADRAGTKSGFTATKEELEADKEKKDAKPTIEYIDEKRTIAGYECSKAIVTSMDKENKPKKIVVWYTDKIKINPSHRRSANRGMTDLGDLKGHPMAMEMTQDYQGGEMKINMTTTEVKQTPIDDAVFVPNTEGYKMMSYKEAKDMMKRPGGGSR